MSSVSKSQAVVLHLTKCGDSGAVVHVLDSVAGRQSWFVRSLGKGKGKRTAQFHSLSILDAVTASSPKSELLYLREYQQLTPLDNIRSDIYKMAVAQFICEVVYRSLRSDDGDETLFEFLVENAVALDSLTTSPANFHLRFMAGFCSVLGFRPYDNWDGDDSPVFDIVSAKFISPTIYHSADQLFSTAESSLLHTILSSPADNLLGTPLSASRRSAFVRKMLRYLSYHLGVNLEIKSLDVLHDIFA